MRRTKFLAPGGPRVYKGAIRGRRNGNPGDVGEEYLNDLQTSRSDAAKEARRDNDDDVIDLHNTA